MQAWTELEGQELGWVIGIFRRSIQARTGESFEKLVEPLQL